MSTSENMAKRPERPEGPPPPGHGSDAPPPGGLRFPDPARLELDQAVERLITTACEVQRTQGRVRALLRAVMSVGGESDLARVLQRLVAAARELTGASWAALVPDEEFARPGIVVDAGLEVMASEPRARITKGLHALRGLLAHRDTVRLDDTADHPAGAPPADTLLGTSIRPTAGGVARLYLADKQYAGRSPGPFTAEDEELLAVLASAAVTAIDHAVLLERTRLRETWQHAHAQIATAVLARADGDRSLQIIAEQALLVADADTAVIALPDQPSGHLVVRAAAGLGSTTLLGQARPLDASLTGRAYTTGRPQITDDARTDYRALTTHHREQANLGPAIVVPLTDQDRPIGTLSVARTATRRRFGPTELQTLADFADQAALVRRLTAERLDGEQLRILHERDRIATELRERTIRDLYSIGLDLHSLAGRLPPRPTARNTPRSPPHRRRHQGHHHHRLRPEDHPRGLSLTLWGILDR